MKLAEIVALVITVAIATVIVFVLQPWLLSGQGFPLGGISLSDLNEWIEDVLGPVLYFAYVLGIVMLLIWFGRALTGNFTQAREVLSTRGMWWIMAFLLGLIPLLAMLVLGFFTGWLYENHAFEPFFWLFAFVVLDVLVLFWLPTALATPKSMRYVPPGSMLLRKIYGG
jgi:hypothetical protein